MFILTSVKLSIKCQRARLFSWRKFTGFKCKQCRSHIATLVKRTLWVWSKDGHKGEGRDGTTMFSYSLHRNICLIKAMDQARMSAWNGTPKAPVPALQLGFLWTTNLSRGRLITSKRIEFKWERSNRNLWKLRAPAMLNKVQGTCHQNPSLPF